MNAGAAMVTGLLVTAAAGTGGWKVHAFARANRELDLRARRCAGLLADAGRAARDSRAQAARTGGVAPRFTLLALDGSPLVFDGRREPGAVRLLFADPASSHPRAWRELIRSYERSALHAPGARVLLLAASGPERTRAALAGETVPWPVGVHAAEVYAAYGFLDGPGMALVEDGVVRERRGLPITGDELPLP